MELGAMFELAFRAIDEYSNKGTPTPVTNGNYIDLKNKMYAPADTAQQELSKITKIPGVQKISQNPITNLLGSYSFDEVQSFPDGTYEYISAGAKSFSIEVDGACSIQFDEYVTSAWVPLNGTYAVDGVGSLTLTGSISVTPSQFTNYRGLLTIASALNPVRMKITPTYPIKTRYRALYAYLYATAIKVPHYSAYIPYDLPTNCMEFNKIMRSYDQRQFDENKDYKLTPDKKIHINWFLTGQFDIHYWKKPTQITTLTLDTYDLEVSEDAQAAMPFFVGGYAIMKDLPSLGVQLVNQYYALRDMLKTPASSTSETVVNTMWKATTSKLF